MIADIWTDILITWSQLRPVDFARPTFLLLWIVTILLPLPAIDRRDPVSAMVYVVFAMGAGAALYFALPQKFVSQSDARTQIFAIVGMGMAAAIRWFYQGEKIEPSGIKNTTVANVKGKANGKG